ncbi:hypothetical protein FKM82_030882 [Ascaphus truei]
MVGPLVDSTDPTRVSDPSLPRSFPCLNGGTCQDESGYADTFTCRCLAGYIGELCQMDVDDCLMRPCANGATCHDGVNRFSCECPPGFQGRFCTVNIDDCRGLRCHNGGRCYDRVGDFECYCAEGFTGKTCEVPVPKPTWEYDQETSARSPHAAGKVTTQAYARVTQPQLVRTAGTGRWSPVPSGTPGTGHFKISVKEVVTQREPGLSERQLVIVMVLGALTGIVVLLTMAVVLWYRSRGERQARCCCYPSQGSKALYSECQDAVPEQRKTTEL